MSDFPQQYVPQLHEIAARLLEMRKPKTDLVHLARDLLAELADLCQRNALDGLAPLADEDHVPAVTAQLETIALDGGGPRSQKPKQVADSLIAGLGLTVVEEPDRTLTFDDTVRAEIAAAIMSAVEPELAVPKIRETIISTARAKIDEQYFVAFEKLAAKLDERGIKLLEQPKVALDAVQAVQRALTESRNALIDRVSRTAIDRAKAVLARTSPEAAERIDQPVTHRLTPRDAAILRAQHTRVTKTPTAVADALLSGLTELARLAWRAPEKPVRTYSAKETFAVGDLIEHPKFGRGTVTAVATSMPRIDVEFSDGKHTLVHVQPKK